jgi:hypothetical protein
MGQNTNELALEVMLIFVINYYVAETFSLLKLSRRWSAIRFILDGMSIHFMGGHFVATRGWCGYPKEQIP